MSYFAINCYIHTSYFLLLRIILGTSYKEFKDAVYKEDILTIYFHMLMFQHTLNLTLFTTDA
jgi:hypothetical protein